VSCWQKEYLDENGRPRDMTRAEVPDALAARAAWRARHGVANAEEIRQQRPPAPYTDRRICPHCAEDMPAVTYGVHLAITHPRGAA
jgi:hypothetical protein